MTPQRHRQPGFRALVCACAAALLFAIAVPHVHADQGPAHPNQVCRACKLQDGFSASPPSAPVSLAAAAPSAPACMPAIEAPRTTGCTPRPAPRAPPISS